MRYVSPFQELGIEADGNLDKSDLNLAKKRLLAELDLSSKPTILRGSVEMTKNDIINQFDKLNSIKNWDFHRLVLADKSLLEFVQNRKWEAKNHLLKEPKYDNPEFVEFISPYFYESYKSLIIKNIAERNAYNLKAVLNISPRLLTEEDHDNVWFSVESFLNGWKDNLDEIAENVQNGRVYDDNALIPFHGKSFMECLNLLPNEFTYFRDDYATSLFNLSANSWNKNKHYRAVYLVKNARLLDISDDTATMLDERIEWFDAELKRINKSDDLTDNWNTSTIARVVFFCIFFIFRLATCDNNSSSNSSSNFVLDGLSYSQPQPLVEPTTRSKINDEYMEKAVREALIKENSKSKTWDIERFYILLNHVKKSEFGAINKLNNTLIVDKCLLELMVLKDRNSRTKTIDKTDDLIAEFKILQVERGLQ
jgi:hypothetical protein